MKSAYVIVALVVLALIGGVSISRIAQSMEQPIPFNHRLHIEDAGMDCTDCHRYAIQGPRATIPNVKVCGECHEEPMTESEHEIQVAEHVREGVPIPWRQVYWVPEHVNFSHRRHTALGNVGCETCHGDVGARNAPLTRPLVQINMDTCMACHEQQGVTNDCVACHR